MPLKVSFKTQLRSWEKGLTHFGLSMRTLGCPQGSGFWVTLARLSIIISAGVSNQTSSEMASRITP